MKKKLQSNKLRKRVNEQSEFLLSGGFWILFDGTKSILPSRQQRRRKNKEQILGFKKWQSIEPVRTLSIS